MPAEDSLDAWLLERYRAFVGSANRDVLEGEVEHESWVVRQVELLSAVNGIGGEWGLELSRPPDMMHFAEGVSARFGSFRRLVSGTSEQKLCDKSVGETSSL